MYWYVITSDTPIVCILFWWLNALTGLSMTQNKTKWQRKAFSNRTQCEDEE